MIPALASDVQQTGRPNAVPGAFVTSIKSGHLAQVKASAASSGVMT
jgi:hypothetical protein